jgi:signal transduction histidine kinase/ligand-binding sensor domain-containing protein/CheY-like chemotaxis protein/AraC-like DNA-binding protein
MWFGTDDGLNRFDGLTFSVYRRKYTDTSSIGGNTILALHEDPSGNLWIGTNESVSLYNRKLDHFTNYRFTAGNTVRSLFCDHEGYLWMGSYVGLFKLNTRNGSVVRYLADTMKKDQLQSNVITCVLEDSRHRRWIGGNAGLYLYQPASDNFLHFTHRAGDPQSLPDNSIKTITEDHNGNIWIGTEDGGLTMLLPDEKHFHTYRHGNREKRSLSCNRIWSLAAANTNHLWVGTEEGLNIFDLHNKTSQSIVHDSRNRYSLQGKSVRSIFIDNNGIYWVGTYQGGVNKYDRNLAFFNLRESNPFDQHGLPAPIVTSFAEDVNHDIYVGTDGGGIGLYHRNTGLFNHPVFSNEAKPPAVLSLENAAGKLWIGTFMHGLYSLDMRSGKVYHFEKGEGSQHLSGNDVFCLKKDSRGHIWIGTNGNGVNVYDPVACKFKRLDSIQRHAGGNLTALTRGFIRTFEEDKAGRIWIGTVGAGIIRLDPTSGKIRVFNRENSDIPANDVQTICADKCGRIWVGMHNGGLYILNEQTGKFSSYTTQDELSNAVIYKILEDDDGKIWVSSNQGICCVDPSLKTIKNFYQYNGLQKSTFCLGAGLKTGAGELFFGGLEGLNYFHPGMLNYNKIVPRIVLTDLRIGNTSVLPGRQSAIQSHISMAEKIRLDYDQHFSISFTTLNYTAPQESRFSYMLEGFEKEWNNVGASRTAVYAHLKPGQYRFRIRACADDGSWHSPEATVQIYVRSPFWLTVYAYLFYALVAFSILWGLRYRGIRKLKNRFALEQERLQIRQAVELDRKEAERQREFEKVKVKYLVNLSHEFRTPVSLIAGPVDKLIGQETSPYKLKQLNMVKRNAGMLLNMVNQLLDFRKLEEQELKLDLSKGDIIDFIAKVVELFNDISEHRQISFFFTSAISRFYTAFDRDKLERVLFNLLSNAFKFTPKGGRISLQIDNDPAAGLTIKVTDTGVGMTKEVQEKIFTRFFQGDVDPVILNQGSGIGLSITHEFVKLHKGSLMVESIPGKGSTFTVILPVEPIEEYPQHEVEYKVKAASVFSPPAAIAAADKLTVLLIEDNEDFRYYLKDSLSPFYKIVEAADGKEGWQKVLSAHPQVIVSDISMPVMDGIQLSRKIKSDKRTNHIPIILLTALSGDASHLNGLQTGANDYLSKPFNIEILNARIRNLLVLNKSLQDTYTRQVKVNLPVTSIESEDERFIIKVTKYIEDNINSDVLTVEELSRHLYMSRASLYNRILNLTGETPVEYIRSIKLLKAASLLKTSDMKIAQIGYAVGFTTPNYFARAFKAKFNMLPSAYQLENRKL